MRRLAFHLVRIFLVVLLGGLLGATLVRASPGFGVDEQELDMRLSHESMQALRQSDASHEPLAAYYLRSLRQMVRGDLGFSRTLQEPVRQLLQERFPETLKSVFYGLVLGWSVSVLFAFIPILLQSWKADLFASMLAGIALSIPAAMLALLFVIGHAPGRLVIGLIVFPKVFRYIRNLLRHSAGQPHVVAAWARGLTRFEIMFRHVLRSAAPQLLALAGVSVTLAFAAAIPVEVVCDLPGIGQLAWKAAMGRDMALLVDLTMIVTLITLVANSAADLMMPRVRTGEI
jgi:peptide/nickel transport system permease protein